ncbi:MAG: glycosyltransferase family 2 protein [Sphingobium sp.]|nr:MAG: glycosyltransferase family 2 protein [Sphingobium sp.]
MTKVCAITMVYNERNNLPIWLRHYGAQVGLENCFVLDHGTDDGSTDDLPREVNRIRIPRSAQDNKRRTAAINALTNSLLSWYDYAIYSDCDELLVADPRLYAGLIDFCEREEPEYRTAIGLNVLHDFNAEPALSSESLVSHQRSLCLYVSPMNKPSLTSVPVHWGVGFHHREKPPLFGGLFLFHLRYADVPRGLQRLDLTRNVVEWPSEKDGRHQRVSDDQWVAKIEKWLKLPVDREDPWSLEAGALKKHVEAFTAAAHKPGVSRVYASGPHIGAGLKLLPLPPEFVGAF